MLVNYADTHIRGAVMYKTVVVKYCAKAKEMASRWRTSPIEWRKKDTSWLRSPSCRRRRGFSYLERTTTKEATRQTPSSAHAGEGMRRSQGKAGATGTTIKQKTQHEPRAERDRWIRRTRPHASIAQAPPRETEPARRSPTPRGMQRPESRART